MMFITDINFYRKSKSDLAFCPGLSQSRGNFFSAAAKMLCFGLGMRMVLITHRCFGFC